jgi:hypothetical protein
MIKKFYFLAWLLFAASVLRSAFTGSFDALAMFVFSLVALGLIYAFALWAVFAPRETQVQ